MSSDQAPKDPDFFIGPFEPLTVEFQSRSEASTLVLGVVKEQGVLYFVLRKRYPQWVVDIQLDKVRLSIAVKGVDRHSLSSQPSPFRTEVLRLAFEGFIKASPFLAYVRETINQWDAAQFFNELRALAPALMIRQPRLDHEKAHDPACVPTTP